MYKMAGAIDDEELLTFREFGSRLQGHPTPEIPWVDVATGSLGQGLPISVGIALAGARLESADFRVWVLCGDSELAEGSMWEAFEQAGHAGLDNLIAIVDVNRLGQRGPTMHEWDTASLAARAEAMRLGRAGDRRPRPRGDRRRLRAGARRRSAPRRSSPAPRRARASPRSRTSPNQHGKPLADPEAAVEELGGVRSLRVEVATPPEAPAYEIARARGRAPGL